VDVVYEAYFVWLVVANVRSLLDVKNNVYLFVIVPVVVKGAVPVVNNSQR